MAFSYTSTLPSFICLLSFTLRVLISSLSLADCQQNSNKKTHLVQSSSLFFLPTIFPLVLNQFLSSLKMKPPTEGAELGFLCVIFIRSNFSLPFVQLSSYPLQCSSIQVYPCTDTHTQHCQSCVAPSAAPSWQGCVTVIQLCTCALFCLRGTKHETKSAPVDKRLDWSGLMWMEVVKGKMMSGD